MVELNINEKERENEGGPYVIMIWCEYVVENIVRSSQFIQDRAVVHCAQRPFGVGRGVEEGE